MRIDLSTITGFSLEIHQPGLQSKHIGNSFLNRTSRVWPEELIHFYQPTDGYQQGAIRTVDVIMCLYWDSPEVINAHISRRMRYGTSTAQVDSNSVRNRIAHIEPRQTRTQDLPQGLRSGLNRENKVPTTLVSSSESSINCRHMQCSEHSSRQAVNP